MFDNIENVEIKCNCGYIHEMHRILELAGLTENITSYNLDQKYTEFNSKFFNNKLPEIPVKWGKLSKVGGIAKCETLTKNNVKTIIPNSMSIKISSVYERDEKNLDGILLHEMIHILMFVEGKFKENHGSLFKNEAINIGNKAGIEIPLTDDTSNLLLANEKLKTVIVIVYISKDGKYCFSMVSPKSYNYDPNTIDIIDRMKKIKDFKTYEITSPIWTKTATRLSVPRSIKSVSQMIWRYATEEQINDLETNGKIL